MARADHRGSLQAGTQSASRPGESEAMTDLVKKLLKLQTLAESTPFTMGGNRVVTLDAYLLVQLIDMTIKQLEGQAPTTKHNGIPTDLIDMLCGNCGHSPESHRAGEGQCYSCNAEKRCSKWEPRSPEADVANRR